MQQCQSCNAVIDEDLDTCPECGTELMISTKVFCTVCKQDFNGELRTCPYCGSTNLQGVPALKFADSGIQTIL